MTDEKLACIYRPKLYFDVKEPFVIDAVGYTIFRDAHRSASFPSRIIRPAEGGCVIEYAFWYDYDIQHLYELEHIWVYLDAEGQILEAEGSFHGKFLRLVEPFANQIKIEDETRVCAYVQPGKHALMAAPELFHLYCGADRCCMEEAGNDGIAPGVMVKDCFDISDELQTKTKKYIKAKYGFRPSFSFETREYKPELLMPWEELLKSIPERMQRQMDIISNWEEEE